jgi:hypothetical protein
VRRATVAAQLLKLTLAGQPRETTPHLAPGEEQVSTSADGLTSFMEQRRQKNRYSAGFRLCKVKNIKIKVVYVENVKELSNLGTFT